MGRHKADLLPKSAEFSGSSPINLLWFVVWLVGVFGGLIALAGGIHENQYYVAAIGGFVMIASVWLAMKLDFMYFHRLAQAADELYETGFLPDWKYNSWKSFAAQRGYGELFKH